MLRAGRMRVVPSLLVACLLAAAPRAQAAPLDAVVFPSAPLDADGERAHLLRLYVVAGDALVAGRADGARAARARSWARRCPPPTAAWRCATARRG